LGKEADADQERRFNLLQKLVQLQRVKFNFKKRKNSCFILTSEKEQRLNIDFLTKA
jgi:hypothetical protein